MRTSECKDAGSGPPLAWRLCDIISRVTAVRRAGAIAMVLVGVAAAPAAAFRDPPSTMLLSQRAGGGLPNGPSCCASVSRDERIGRVIAYETRATDAVRPARRGVSNIVAVVRARPWRTDGSPWVAGASVLVSRGLRGRAANGSSYDPQVSGDSAHVPRCVAFVSRASNLVPGDTNGHADAFVGDFQTGTITRVSVRSGGRQSQGTVSAVGVDGACTRAVFTSDAGDLARGTGRRPEVYVHFLARHGATARRTAGLTRLVSTAAGGAPAGGAGAFQPSMSSDGRTVAYVSSADLGAPAGGVAQVWQARLALVPRRGGRSRVVVRTRLVSAGPDGRAGAAPSWDPSSDYNGAAVAFTSVAPSLAPGGPPGVAQVVEAFPGRPGATLVASEPEVAKVIAPGNAPSFDADISEGGQWVFFDSRATNLLGQGGGVRINQREIYRRTDPSLKATADVSGVQLKSMAGPGTGSGYPSETPASAPAASSRGNYLTFESEDPRLDAPAARRGPAWALAALDRRGTRPQGSDFELLTGLPAGQLAGLPGAGGQLDPGLPTAPADPRLHQVYLRYLGPQ